MNEIYQKPFPTVKNVSKGMFGPLFNKRHSRALLSGIFRRYSGALCRLNEKNNEDPRQVLSGMTTSFHKDPACAGFTLIELLVVVLIIGILSSIALPQYTAAVEKSRMSEALSVIAALQNNVELYVLENGFPRRNIGLTGDGSGNYSVDMGVSLSSLSCENNTCSSKYFSYSAHCGTTPGIEKGQCFIDAARKDKDGERLYHISRARNESGWDILRCFNWENTSVGKKMCRIINGY